MSRTLLELNATVDQTDKSKSQRTCVSLNECENHDLIWLSVQWAKRHFTMPHQEGIWKSAIRCCNLEQIRILAISVCYGTRSHAHTVKQPPPAKTAGRREKYATQCDVLSQTTARPCTGL